MLGAILSLILGAVIVGAGIAVILAIVIGIPLTIYVFPYSYWVGSQNCIGKHKDKKKESLRSTVRNATKLYKCWIRRQEPNF